MEKFKSKVKDVAKKYGYYILSGVMAIAITLTIALTFGGNRPASNNSIEVSVKPVIFAIPIDGGEVIKGYSNIDLLYNETMNEWNAHKAIDIAAKTDLSVVSVLDGVVLKVSSNYAEGDIVEITHDNGLKTRYSSLDNIKVKQGDKVKKGTKLGDASKKAKNEQAQKEHVHFEVFKDGTSVDPSNYLDLLEK